MAEIKRQHELFDVYAAFGERCQKELLEPEKDQPKESLNVTKALLVADMQSLGVASAEDFDSIQKGHPDAAKTYICHATQSSENPDLSFSVQKKFFKETVSEIEKPFFRKPYQDEMEMVSLIINKRNKDYQIRVGNMDLVHVKNEEWNISDRFVEKRFRGQGVAKALLIGAEAFVQKYADKTKTPQTVFIELSQPSVLVTFLNVGYVAATEEDQKRIDAMLSGAPELYLSFIQRPDGSARLEFLDAYCFDSRKVPPSVPDSEKTPFNSYRIKLVKKFQPKNSAVDEEIMHFGKYMTW